MIEAMFALQNLPPTVQTLLRDREFKVNRKFNNFRYLLMQGTMPDYNVPVMIKIESGNLRNSIQQRNHVIWTESVRRTIPANANFDIAPVLEDGYIDGTWHWFIMPFVEGKPFATRGEDAYLSEISVSEPEEIMPRIVSLMKHVEKTPATSMMGIDARYAPPSKKNKAQLIETAISWARNDTPYLAELLQIIQANYEYLGSSNAHGDFTDVNIIINTVRQPVLIDAEMACANHYKYYDAAEFYNRLFTLSCTPELAKVFLDEYIKALPKQSVQRFLNNFLCLSALRCIGNFMEIAALPDSPSKEKRRSFAVHYATAVVTYKVIRVN